MSRYMQLWLKGAKDFQSTCRFLYGMTDGTQVTHQPKWDAEKDPNDPDDMARSYGFANAFNLVLVRRRTLIWAAGPKLRTDVSASFTLNDKSRSGEWEAQCIRVAILALQRDRSDLLLLGDEIPLLVRSRNGVEINTREAKRPDFLLDDYNLDASLEAARVLYRRTALPAF